MSISMYWLVVEMLTCRSQDLMTLSSTPAWSRLPFPGSGWIEFFVYETPYVGRLLYITVEPDHHMLPTESGKEEAKFEDDLLPPPRLGVRTAFDLTLVVRRENNDSERRFLSVLLEFLQTVRPLLGCS
jgi:hypothetical protein